MSRNNRIGADGVVRPAQRFAELITTLSSIKRDDARNGAAAHLAEIRASREHDAVDLGPEVTFGFVHGALESSHLCPVFFTGKQFDFERTVLPEERFHFRFGLPLGADLFAPLLVFNGVFFKFILEPWCRNRRTRLHSIFPFEIAWIEQGSNVGFPGLKTVRGRKIRYR